MTNIFETEYGRVSGRGARLFHLENEFMRICVTDYGAALTGIFLHAADGRTINAVLSCPDAGGYERGSSSIGATVGRYAGRIANARFSLDGKEFLLEKNDGENHLHGGFNKRFWDSETIADGVRFTLVSADGDEGFPGELCVGVSYELIGSKLRLSYSAETDSATVLNLTNHSYFNLAGGGDISSHMLRLAPDEYAELDSENIPTGRFENVRGTRFDFTEARPIGSTVIDHSFILNNGGALCEAARLYCPETGLGLICLTDQPTVHVYTADYVQLDTGGVFPKRGGVCLETQHLPDSPNKPCFPSVILRKGERFESITEFILTGALGS